MKNLLSASILASATLLSYDTQAQVGDPVAGLSIAKEMCSTCHAVQKGEARSPNSRSPTFDEFANVPGMTAIALNVTLTTPHAGMPMFVLTAEQRADLIVYILSLKDSAAREPAIKTGRAGAGKGPGL
jgi:mono/diheme cytochrome c family protein